LTTLRIGNIRTMLGVSFLQMLAFYSCVSALFLQSRGLNFTEILALESFVAAGIFLFEIPSGVWADRFGRRRLLVVANALAVVGMAIFATGHHFLFFALESFLGGIGIACASGADQALIYDSLQAEGREGEARRVFGRLSAAGTVGHLVAYPIGGLLASYSLALPVYVTLISSVLALLLVLQLEEPPRTPLEGPGDVEDAGGTTAQSSTGTWAASWQGLKDVLGRRRLLAFSLATGAVWTLYHNLYYLNQPVFARGGLPIVYFGLAAAAMSGSRLLALKVDSFAVRLGEGGVVRLMMGAVGAGFIALSFARHWLPATLLMCMIFAAIALLEPIRADVRTRSLPSAERATLVSALSMLSSLVGLGMRLLIGRLTDYSLTAGLAGSGLIVLAALVAASRARGQEGTLAPVSRRVSAND